MTLTIGVLTPTCVYLASDRRVTVRRLDGTVSVEDDEHNKAVVWCRRIAFAFTGLADLGPDERTDLWLAHTLASIEGSFGPTSHGHGWLLDELAKRATWEFDRPSLTCLAPEQRRHAFVGVGWARFAREALEPYRALVSNFHGDDLEQRPQAAREFRVFVRPLRDDEGGCLEVIPEAMSADQVQRVIAQAAYASNYSSSSQGDLVTALIGAIRQAADSTPHVGRGQLVSVIPRRAVDRDARFLVAGGFEPDAATFIYVPAGGGTGVTYGPTTVCQGAITSDFSARSAPDGG